MFKTKQEIEGNLNRINKKENIALKKRKAIGNYFFNNIIIDYNL